MALEKLKLELKYACIDVQAYKPERKNAEMELKYTLEDIGILIKKIAKLEAKKS